MSRKLTLEEAEGFFATDTLGKLAKIKAGGADDFLECTGHQLSHILAAAPIMHQTVEILARVRDAGVDFNERWPNAYDLDFSPDILEEFLDTATQEFYRPQHNLPRNWKSRFLELLEFYLHANPSGAERTNFSTGIMGGTHYVPIFVWLLAVFNSDLEFTRAIGYVWKRSGVTMGIDERTLSEAFGLWLCWLDEYYYHSGLQNPLDVETEMTDLENLCSVLLDLGAPDELWPNQVFNELYYCFRELFTDNRNLTNSIIQFIDIHSHGEICHRHVREIVS